MTPDQVRRNTVKRNLAGRRCYATGFDETTGLIFWVCKEGHEFTSRLPRWKTMTYAIKKFTKQPNGYWTKAGGGCSTLCPKCWAAKRKELGL